MANMVAKDKYRSILHGEAENIHWRHGGPPTYGLVNQLFEEGRTKVNHHTLLILSLLFPLNYIMIFLNFVSIFLGMARRIIGGDSSKCY